LRHSGEFPPDGLEYHVAFSSGGSFRVSEIWDSEEQFKGLPVIVPAAKAGCC